MVILNAVLFSLPSIVVTLLGANGSVLISYRMYKIVVYFEIAFVLEDVFLESLYLYYFWLYMQDVPGSAGVMLKKRMWRTFYMLLGTSLIVLICDVLGLVLLLMKILLARYTILGILYGIKLNAEFFVLSRLLDTVNLKNEVLKRGNMSGPLVVTETTIWTNDPRDCEEQRQELKAGQIGAGTDEIEPLQHRVGHE